MKATKAIHLHPVFKLGKGAAKRDSRNFMFASLLMANVQATLRGQTLVGTSAKECIIRSNKLLHDSTSSEKFVTLFYGIIDSTKHEMVFCNAGHDNPFLFSVETGSTPRRLQAGGIVLSIMEPFPYEEDVVPIRAGDVLVIYSDGIPEAMNTQQEQFGEERLSQVIYENRSLSAMELIDKIVASAKTHAGAMPQSDDMTLIVVKRLAE